MTNNSTKSVALQSAAETAAHLLDDWFDPIEAGLRDRVRELIQGMIESELEAALSRPRYARRPKEASENADVASGVTGHRHGHRSRSLLGTFGPGRDRGAAGTASGEPRPADYALTPEEWIGRFATGLDGNFDE